jgi:hypothetical protein
VAQDAPVADTPTPEFPTFTPTATITPEIQICATPSHTPTSTEITDPITISPTSAPRVVPIPEPVTPVLFLTGLATLSAAVAARRGRKGK